VNTLLLNREEAHEVLSHLASLGYELIPDAESRLHGRLRAKFIDTDDELNSLVRYLQSCTPLRKLNSVETADFWRKLTAGYRILKPEHHPSGMRTSEQAHTPVKAMGAFVKHGAADTDIHGNPVPRKR
jgi:hypothetical protein